VIDDRQAGPSPSLYDIGIERLPPLVPRSRRLEVRGRLDATGRELQPVDADAVPPLPEGTDAVAICLLHADSRRKSRSDAWRRGSARPRDRVRRHLLERGLAGVPRVRAAR